MKLTRILSALFGLLFPLLLCAALVLSFSMRGKAPLTLGGIDTARRQTEQLMDAICAADFSAAEDLISGSPKLTAKTKNNDALTVALWDAYYSSISYHFLGDCYADDYGLYRDVSVTYIDIPALMDALQLHAPLLLADKAAEAHDSAYGADGEYTPEFISETLAAEAKKLLQTNAYTVTRTLTLQPIGSGGHWVIQNTPELMDFISGSMGGA